MDVIERWVDVAVPIAVADQEWTRFMLRTIIGHYKVTAPEVEWSLAEEAEQEGLVDFHRLDSGHTRVTVRLDYTGDTAVGRAVAEHLARDLDEYRRFIEGQV